jgi:hypothetical protein
MKTKEIETWFRKKIVYKQQYAYRNIKAKRMRELTFLEKSKSETSIKGTKDPQHVIFQNQGKTTYTNCQFTVGEKQDDSSICDEKIDTKKSMNQYTNPYTGVLEGSPPRFPAPAARRLSPIHRNTELPVQIFENIRKVLEYHDNLLQTFFIGNVPAYL